MEIARLETSNKNPIIKQAIEVLKSGGLVVYPTETCYGLGADATNQTGIDKLLKFKTRREGKAFSVAVTDQQMAEKYVELNQIAKNLYKNFLPGPLTVVSRAGKNHNLATGVLSEFNTLGIRIPDHPLAIELVKKLSVPITATSANVSYQAPPYSLQQWQKQTPKKSQEMIDLWIDAGKLPQKPPSTVIDTTVDELTVLRQGSLKFEAKLEIVTKSEEETHKLAEQLINSQESTIKKSGLVMGLQGELGAGKTQFAKGVAQALKIKQPLRSPTFILVHEYLLPSKGNQKPETRNYLYHIDTWRMENDQELKDIYFEKMLKPGNIVVIEWVEKVKRLVKEQTKKHKTKVVWGAIEVLDKKSRKWKFSENAI